MKNIHITRNGSKVTFETVSVDTTENVFFTNVDDQPHKPSILKLVDPEQLGPGQRSSQVPVPPPPAGQTKVTYGCDIAGHTETGVINVFPPLAAVNTTLKPATKGQAIATQQVVKGGMSPYQISDQAFEVTGDTPQSGSGSIGPGLILTSDPIANTGITASGIPSVSGTYNFTFTVDDAMGRNLQLVQYTMIVA